MQCVKLWGSRKLEKKKTLLFLKCNFYNHFKCSKNLIIPDFLKLWKKRWDKHGKILFILCSNWAPNSRDLTNLFHKYIFIQCCGKSLLNILTIPVTTYICKFFFIWLITISISQKWNREEKRLSWFVIHKSVRNNFFRNRFWNSKICHSLKPKSLHLVLKRISKINLKILLLEEYLGKQWINKITLFYLLYFKAATSTLCSATSDCRTSQNPINPGIWQKGYSRMSSSFSELACSSLNCY